MECDEHGLEHTEPAAVRGRGLKRKRDAGGARDVRLAFTATVPGAAAARAVPLPAHAPRALAAPLLRPDAPFMSNMDEISYWVYTKRAPCLFNYDSIIKQQSEQAQCSNTKAPSKEEEPSPKKMRKLKLLEEDSMSTEKQQNVFFKAPQIQKPNANSRKSEEASSDIDFNIKVLKTPKKSKNLKSQKNCPTRVPKKIKVSTSTPKVANLRRSLRKAQQSCNNNSHLNSSFEIFNASIVNGKQDLVEEEAEPDRATHQQNKSKSRSSGASRYPRRQNNNTGSPEPNCTTTIAISNANTTNRRYNMRKGTLNMNRKENSEEKLVSRTRSGKRRGLQLDIEKSCAVLQLNSSTEPVSSSPAVNVAGPNTRSTKNTASTRCLRSRTLRDKVVHLYKESSSEGSDRKLSGGMHCALEQSTPKSVKKVKKTVDRPGQSLGSLRDKSGFAACFSDSDSDSAPLNRRKFFC